MMWASSYLGAHWALILAVVAAVIALGFAAFFLKNWKLVVAIAAVLGVAFAFQEIDKNAYQRRVAEENAKRIADLEANVKLSNDIADDHMKRAEADAIEIEHLKELAAQTPPNPSACFDVDTARRLRDFRRSIGK